MRRLITYSLALSLLLVGSLAQAAHSLKHVKDLVWASPKGFALTLDIAIPETKAAAKPVLIIFHGGGFLLNNKSIMTDLADEIATRADVITVNANYRLLSDLGNTTTINEIIDDGMGAVLWVKDNIAQYGGDPHKIAVTGDSAGGHLAAMVVVAGRNLSSEGFAKKPLGFKPTYLPKNKTAEQIAKDDGLKIQAAILSYAGFSLLGMANNGFEGEGNPFWKWANAKPRGFFGDKINSKSNPEFYLALSPDQYLIDAKEYKFPPQFIHVGELDPLTKPEFAKQYVEKLTQLGQDVKFTIYTGKSHGFLDGGCNEYNHGCFKDLSQPTLDDMIIFLKQVFQIK